MFDIHLNNNRASLYPKEDEKSLSSLISSFESFLDKHQTAFDWIVFCALVFAIFMLIVSAILILQDLGIVWFMHDPINNYGGF